MKLRLPISHRTRSTKFSFRIGFESLLLASLFFLACTPQSNRQTAPIFPYQFQTVREIDTDGVFFDLNHDGRDEYLNFGEDPSNNHSQFILQNNDFEIVDQVNFTGKIQFATHFDWNGDGTDEIAVAYTRHDSSFLRLVDAKCHILKESFLFSGKPLISKSASHPWVGTIKAIDYTDLDGNGKKEVIVFPAEGYARSPRGVFVYDGRTLHLKWKYLMGPLVSKTPIILDTNHDGKKEILLGSSSPCNGYQENGTDDQHSWLFLLSSTGKLIWKKREGKKFTGIRTFFEDFNGNGRQEVLLAIFKKYSATSQPCLEFINPQTGLPLIKRNFPFADPFEWTVSTGQFDLKPGEECVLSSQTGELMILNHRFEKIRKAQFDFSVSDIFTCEDLNGDGRDEIFVQSNGQYYWLGSDLRLRGKTPLSILPQMRFIDHPQVYHRHDQPPLLTSFSKNGNARLVRIVRNPNYFYVKYGKKIIWSVVGLFFIGLFMVIVQLDRKRRFGQMLLEKEIGFRRNPVLILNHRNQITQMNFNAQQVLGLSNARLPIAVETLSESWGALTQFLRNLPNEEPIRQETQFETKETRKRFRAVAEPVVFPGKRRSFWVVFILDISAETELQSAKAWSAMAQRIAHDIKNPLTSILLTQQRLQREYKKRDPKHAHLYEPYTERILNRIEALRRMTREFMKFVNVEKINPQPTDLNAFVRDFLASDFMEWPADIYVKTDFQPDLPPVLIDQEQMQTLLENLFGNAINAMKNGGVITISTNLAPDLQWHSSKHSPMDFVVLEILDTGKGIEASLKEKIFRPFTTNTHLGTGLGLTIVKKIVDDHRGHIEIESEVGVGTSVIVYLPVA